MACDPNELAQLARCFACLSPAQLLEVQTYLICLINDNGGGGGGVGAQEVFFGNGSPVGVVIPTATNAIYGDKDTGNLWWWYDATWH